MASLPRISLNEFVPWAAVLGVLDIPIPFGSLPVRIVCPFCAKEEMTIYDDYAVGGSWFHCTSCGFADDAIGVASQKWDLPRDDTIRRIQRTTNSSLPKTLEPAHYESYMRSYPAKRARVAEFWATCRQAALDGHPARALREQLEIREPKRREAGAWILGYSSRTDVEQCFNPGRFAYRNSGRDDGRHTTVTGENHTFVGPGWADLLVIPFYDLPGRQSGFVLVGRDGNPDTDWVYRTALSRRPKHVGDQHLHMTYEAGVAMLDALSCPPHEEFGDTAFVVDDLEMAVRAQMHQVADGSRPLPLVATWSNSNARTQRVFDSLPTRPLIFWSAAPTASLFLMARSAGGRVSLASKADLKQIDLRQGDALLRAMESSSVSWEAALERTLATLDRAACESIFLRLDLQAGECHTFLEGCAPETRRRLAPILAGHAGVNSVAVRQATVVSTEKNWQIKKTGEVICDAPFTLDTVIHQPGRDRTFYQGSVRYKGIEHPFSVDAAEITADPFGWIRLFLLRKKAGLPLCSKSWSQHAFMIAQQLHPPVYKTGAEAVGWDADSRSFIFPSFAIRADGRQGENEPVLIPDENPPCLAFQPASPLTEAEIEALGSVGILTSLFWASAAAILANIVAPAIAAPLTRVALVGDAAQIAGRAAAKALGCLEIVAPGALKMSLIRSRAEYAAAAHPWPVLIARPATEGQQDLPAPIVEGLPRGVIVPLSSVASLAHGLQPGWTAVRARTTRYGPIPAADLGGPRLGSCYLASLAERQMVFLDNQPSLAASLLEDMAAWFESQGGNGAAVRRGATYLDGDDEAASLRRLEAIVGLMFNTSDLSIRTEPLILTRLPNEAIPTEGGVHLAESTLRRFLAKHDGPPLDSALVTEILTDNQVLVREDTLGSEYGWVIREAWLEKCRRGLRLSRPPDNTSN